MSRLIRFLSSALVPWLLLPALVGAQLVAAGARLTFDGGQVPTVAVDPLGASLVAWNELAFRFVDLRTFDAEGQIAARAVIKATGPDGEIILTDVAAAGSGTFLLAWVTRERLAENRRFIRLFGLLGRPRSGLIELPHPVGRLARNRNGDTVGIWQEFLDIDPGQGLGRSLVRGRRLSSQGVPLGHAFTVRASDDSGGFLDGPEVAIDGRGRFGVTWREAPRDREPLRYFFQRYRRDGTKLGNKRPVSREKPKAASGAAVAMDPSGDFVIVWESDLLKARWFDQFGRPLSGAVRLSEPDENPTGPEVAKDRFGNTVILWSVVGEDADPDLVLARVFDPMGDPVGDEIVIGPGLFPAFGIDDEGGVAVTWSHRDKEGREKAIVQRFALACAPGYEHRCPDQGR